MILADCVVEFRAGYLTRAVIKPAIGGGGWYLELSGKFSPFNLQRQRGGDCIYKTLDAAWSAAWGVGFKDVTIQHSGNMLDYL